MYGTRYTYVKKSDAKRVPHLLFKTAYLRCLVGHPTEAALPVVVAKIRLPQQPITGISLAACTRPMTNQRPTKQPTHQPTNDRPPRLGSRSCSALGPLRGRCTLSPQAGNPT